MYGFIWRLILGAMLAQLRGHRQPHLCQHRLAQKVDLQLLLAAAQYSSAAVRDTLWQTSALWQNGVVVLV
jgi:hypothetical protein